MDACMAGLAELQRPFRTSPRRGIRVNVTRWRPLAGIWVNGQGLDELEALSHYL